MNTTSDEIKTLVKLRHPDPDSDIDAFIDSLPDEVVIDHYGDRYRAEAPVLRNALKIFFYMKDDDIRSNTQHFFSVKARAKQIAKLQGLLHEYYK